MAFLVCGVSCKVLFPAMVMDVSLRCHITSPPFIVANNLYSVRLLLKYPNPDP